MDNKIYYIEGCDYSGKTTLINNLQSKLINDGYRVEVYREPSGLTRKILLDPEVEKPSPLARRFYFLSNHIDLCQRIRTRFNRVKNTVFIIDRTSLITDKIYAPKETEKHEELINAVYNIFMDTDKHMFDNFFKNNSNLIVLRISNKEFELRIDNREDINDNILDLRSYDFKRSILRGYNEEFAINTSKMSVELKDERIGEFFKNIYVINSDNGLMLAENAFNIITDKPISEDNEDVYALNKEEK